MRQFEIQALWLPGGARLEACVFTPQFDTALAAEVNLSLTSAAEAGTFQERLNCTPEGVLHPKSVSHNLKLTQYRSRGREPLRELTARIIGHR